MGESKIPSYFPSIPPSYMAARSEWDLVRNCEDRFCHKTAQKCLTRKVPNTTISEFANTVDPDETAHNEPPHLDLQYLPSSL